MKTQILHLDPHDDILSARDKMGWGKASRVLLVWPARGQVLRRRLDLVLLQRHSKRLGVQLALVTMDPNVRAHAGELAIPVFKTLGQAQKAAWRVPRQHRLRAPVLPPSGERPRPDLAALRQAAHPAAAAWTGHPAARLGFFCLGILALLSIAAILLPAARLELAPKTRTQAVALEVRASRAYPVVNLAGWVPARPVRVIVEGRRSLRASGTTQVPDQPASGRAVLTNLTDEPVAVPAGTVVRALGEPPARFATTRAGQVPAGPGKTLTLPVRALQPGRAGNLPAGKLAALEGPLGLRLTAANPDPLRGGTDRTGPAPSGRDYDRLEADLEAALRLTALEELAAGLKPGDVLIPDSLTLWEVVERAFEPAETQPADWLNLSLRVEYEALVASGEDLRSLAVGALDANLPDAYQAEPGSLKITHLSQPRLVSDGAAHWRLEALRELQAQVSTAQAIQLSRGLTPALAKQRLSAGLALASPARITLLPGWWPRLPFVPFRIEVTRAP